MKTFSRVPLVVLAAFALSGPALASEPPSAKPLQIDITVVLKDAKIVFNMNQLTFAGDQPVGLTHMKILTQRFKADRTTWQMIAVFHGAAGFMLLNDAAYNKVRRTERGNPYKDLIAELQREGIAFEECGQTAKTNNWTNADFLPGVKVNAGANLRLVELMQSGFTQLQP